MGIPDDANPMNRRLPAEVVSRRRKPDKGQATQKEEQATSDRAAVLNMKPEHRLRWLSKALQNCQEGTMANTIVYDIVTHKQFTQDVTEKVGVKILRSLQSSLPLFSTKQQRFLQEDDCRLVQLFGNASADHRAQEGDADDLKDAIGSLPATVAPVDDEVGKVCIMLPPGGIEALWEGIARLASAERAEYVLAMDPDTKDLLEKFLEERIAQVEGAAGAAEASAAGGRSRSEGSDRRSRSRSDSGSAKAKARRGSRRRVSRSRSRSRNAKKGEGRERREKDKARDDRSRRKGKRRERSSASSAPRSRRSQSPHMREAKRSRR
mmetsp:Transcript_40519/g.86970  ORF Transcript_40519/g.86970 Transcript_40519/m.86970 type:complete len:322 (-) Transcript_40519:63-1028(-)